MLYQCLDLIQQVVRIGPCDQFNDVERRLLKVSYQGKANLQAPWLGLTSFIVLAVMLSLLIFVGEAVRDAFDPRKTFH